MRSPRFWIRRWRSISRLRQDSFVELLNDSSADVLDNDFFSNVRERLFASWRFSFKLFSLQIPIIIFLVFALIPIEINFSLFGISPAANRSLREALVLLSALFAIVANVVGLHRAILEDMLRAHTQRIGKGKKAVVDFLRTGIGVDLFIIPSSPKGWDRFGPSYYVALATLIVALILIFLTLLAGGLAIHILILGDIYADPTFSRFVSVLVIVFVVFSDFVSLILTLLQMGLVPIHDFSPLRSMDRIAERDIERARRVHKHIAQEHARRSWLAKTFLRPRIPPDPTSIK